MLASDLAFSPGVLWKLLFLFLFVVFAFLSFPTPFCFGEVNCSAYQVGLFTKDTVYLLEFANAFYFIGYLAFWQPIYHLFFINSHTQRIS